MNKFVTNRSLFLTGRTTEALTFSDQVTMFRQ